MNGTTADYDILRDVAASDVIMVEVLMYWLVSMAILLAMDFYAAKRIGGRNRMGYQVLKPHRGVAALIICGFTVVIGLLCLLQDFSCTRGTLTYFGMPYLIGLVYYLVKMLRRVQAETLGRPF